jgi:hypothetical protein
MNIALGAVFIFILLLPPIAFYVSYSYGRFAKAVPKFSLLDGLLASAIFSLFIHAFAIILLALIGKEVRFDILLKLVGGELKDVENKISNARFNQGLRQFAFYNASIFLLAIVLGRAVRYLVIRKDMHGNSEILRLNNRWWYLFNGYYLTEIGTERHDFDLLFVDAVVDTNDGTLIYSGYLMDFVCNGEELDRIYLNDTIRRELKKKRVDEKGNEMLVNEPGEPVEIPGHFFSVAYRDIKNLNLRFLTFENSLDDIEELSDDFPSDEDISDAEHAAEVYENDLQKAKQ